MYGVVIECAVIIVGLESALASPFVSLESHSLYFAPLKSRKELR